jgi:hypothetical protein
VKIYPNAAKRIYPNITHGYAKENKEKAYPLEYKHAFYKVFRGLNRNLVEPKYDSKN